MNQIYDQLTIVWKEVLELDSLAITDNFFELGATSTRIVQLHEKINTLYPEVITVADIFTAPTIESLGLVIAERISENKTADVNRIDF